MLVGIRALNARIRANPVTDYVCSTHFWGPVSTFGLPVAAILDTQREPDIISGRMTVAMIATSAVLMRYALAVTPKNYLLFACHAVNCSAQLVQGYRFVNYKYLGGQDRVLERSSRKREG